MKLNNNNVEFSADEMKIGVAFSLALKNYFTVKQQELIEKDVLSFLADSLKSDNHPLNALKM